MTPAESSSLLVPPPLVARLEWQELTPLQSRAQAHKGSCVLGKKVRREPSHLVTRGASGARRTNGTSQTTDTIFARSTISTFGTSIPLKTQESMRLLAWGKEVTFSTLLVSGTPPQLMFALPHKSEEHKIFQG